MVKDEMGRDAVILHTKRYRQGGFLGYRSKEVVEVTAALEDTPKRSKAKAPTVSRIEAPIRPAAPARSSRSSRSSRNSRAVSAVQMTSKQAPRQVLAQYKTAGTAEGVSLARTSAELMDNMTQASAKNMDMGYMAPEENVGFVPMEPRSMETRTLSNMEPIEPVRPLRAVGRTMPVQSASAVAYDTQDYAAVPEQPLYQQEPVQQAFVQGPVPVPFEAEPAAAPQEEVKPHIVKPEPEAAKPAVQPEPQVDKGEEKIQALEDELAQMRLMLKQVMGQTHAENEIVTLQDALKEQALNEQVMQDVIRKISPAALLAPKDSDEAMKALSEYLHSSIKTGDGIGLKDGRPKIVALIGTTGVGKTTTIAKIAARFVLERGVNVALITADTYRISAVDQLKTYSDIIGLPLEIVYSAAELKPALRKHKGKQLILIDTAGRSQNNDYQMQELKEFLAVDPSIEKHLVMSATTKERDAEAIMDRFSICKPDRVIFTKTDETDSMGFVVNLLYDRRVALSYLTNGQSVPDDIEPAKPEALAKLLLR